MESQQSLPTRRSRHNDPPLSTIYQPFIQKQKKDFAFGWRGLILLCCMGSLPQINCNNFQNIAFEIGNTSPSECFTRGNVMSAIEFNQLSGIHHQYIAIGGTTNNYQILT